jgi:UDP-N-acetylglucosamine acyltransferase
MPSIHPTAVLHPGAQIADDCTVGPYCVLGEHVVLGPRTVLHSHVVLEGHTFLGSDNEVFPFACLGGKTQDLKYRGGITHVRIGDHNVFREYCTVHAATADGQATVVGSHNHFLAYTHLAHDVQVGNHVIMSNVATLAGHVTVEDHVVIGGLAAVHQFCRIGRHAMIGGCSKVVQDVAPFMMADGSPAETRFINKVGLERAGFTPDAISLLTKAYKVLFRSGLTTANALARIESEVGDSPEVRHLVAFTQSSERGLAK